VDAARGALSCSNWPLAVADEADDAEDDRDDHDDDDDMYLLGQMDTIGLIPLYVHIYVPSHLRYPASTVLCSSNPFWHAPLDYSTTPLVRNPALKDGVELSKSKHQMRVCMYSNCTIFPPVARSGT
jgi:hypothetical protein